MELIYFNFAIYLNSNFKNYLHQNNLFLSIIIYRIYILFSVLPFFFKFFFSKIFFFIFFIFFLIYYKFIIIFLHLNLIFLFKIKRKIGS